MKRIYGILLATGLFGLSACEKIIIPDLNPGQPRLVIEGGVTNGAGPYTVRLTRSADYYQPGNPVGVAGAVITIADDRGKLDTLTYTSNGTYLTKTTKGAVGRTYTLRVVAGGTTYLASSTLPAPVPITRLTYETQQFGKVIYANYTDPAAADNYYRWVLYINGQKQPGLFTDSDRLNNGLNTRQPLFSDPNGNGTKIDVGDRVRVEMQCIDPVVFTYFFALSQTVGDQNQAATPANPTSNLSGGALGYFSAYSVTTDSLTIK